MSDKISGLTEITSVASTAMIPVVVSGGTVTNRITKSNFLADAPIDYFSTSTKTGWAASPTGNIWYKLIGTRCFIIGTISGTSNATSANFTIPYTPKNLTNGYIMFYVRGTDNGVQLATPAHGQLTPNNATVSLYKDQANTAWTASGTKTVYFSFDYEIA